MSPHVLHIYDTPVLHAILVSTLVYMLFLVAFLVAGGTSAADLLKVIAVIAQRISHHLDTV